jgi:hypothetical protein
LKQNASGQPTPTIKRGLGVIAFCTAALLLAAAARGADSRQAAPAAASQAEAAAPAHPSHEQLAKEMEAEPCPCMRSKMGMTQMGKGPGPMPGMGGMMGMPGMEMGGMGMMPMMHEHMLMHVMMRNPKLAGKMMQMRADMMRAVADVLTKYGKEMESGQWPAAKDKGNDSD